MSAASTLEDLERMTRWGWRLLPCAARGKAALLKRWPDLASSDIATIRGWAAEHPNCNWGVATGPSSHVFVVDVDGPVGTTSLAALERQHGAMPFTLTSLTGRGEHRWLNYPDHGEVRGSIGKLAEGLDIRGNGGYVIVPPSIHPSGRAYEWVEPQLPIANAPDWLLDSLSSKNQIVVPPAEHIGILHEGQRNDSLFRFGCAMRRRGATQAEIEQRLLQKNSHECKSPLDIEEISRIATSAAKYEPGGPDPLESAWNEVQNGRHPRGYAQFIALARALQLSRPALPIVLPLKRIGGLMECDWTQARRWRKYAVRDGWLVLVQREIPHVRAAQFTFHEVINPNCPTKASVPLAFFTNGLGGHRE